KDEIATWERGDSTWGGQARGIGTVPVCVSVHERAGGEGRVLAGKGVVGYCERDSFTFLNLQGYTSQMVVMAMMDLGIRADTMSTEQQIEDIIQSLINLPDGPELKIKNKDTRIDAVLTGKGFLEKGCKY
nr:hypothetical protein [Tanacetum cinerariifolium]